MFNDYYSEWGCANLGLINSDLQLFKLNFENYIKKKFMEFKTKQFFDIISSFPDSLPALLDIKISLNFYPVLLLHKYLAIKFY